MMRWNDVIGRPSHAPNRVRGATSAGADSALLGSASGAAGASVAVAPSARRWRNRESSGRTVGYPAARTAAANASPRWP